MKNKKFIRNTAIFFVIVIISAIIFINILIYIDYPKLLTYDANEHVSNSSDNDFSQTQDDVGEYITYPQNAYTKGVLDPQKLESIPALNQDSNLILVNKQYVLDQNFVPDVEEIEGFFLKQEAIDAYMLMKNDASLEGVDLKIGSAYRSYDYQVELFNSYLQKDSYEEVITYSAYPGTSEHQTGLVIDFFENGECDYNQCFEDTPSGQWLFENANRYGFILRYPKNKEDITGYMYEPWHYRYVGEDAAQEIYKNNQTLEEYILLNNDLDI